ncbi:MAG: helix-turn-helix domain-containing protein [Coriobacteriales bacterium]|jgi:repressor LexA|nr:helix-turn-helix domain-containing protein [Coriobacteriales bacterium]
MQARTRIRQFRTLAGLTQEELSEKTGIPLGTLRRWEQEVSEIRNAQRLVPIADILGCTVDDLLGRTERPLSSETTLIPCYGRIAAGEPIEMLEVIEMVEGVGGICKKHPYAYFLVVSGDSMNNEVPNGHYALIDPTAAVHNGDIAAVTVNGCDAALKRWYKTSNSVVLSPDSTNPAYKDIVIDETSLDAPSLHVLGKYIMSISPYRG